MPARKCINLKACYGDRYRVELNPSYHAEHGRRSTVKDPWYYRIPCRHGHIVPWGGDCLGVTIDAQATDCAESVAWELRSLPFAVVMQDERDGFTAVFSSEHFAVVARLAGAKQWPTPAEHSMLQCELYQTSNPTATGWSDVRIPRPKQAVSEVTYDSADPVSLSDPDWRPWKTTSNHCQAGRQLEAPFAISKIAEIGN